jgi:hypothetical protein
MSKKQWEETKKILSTQHLKEWHGYIFLLCPSNKAPCHVISKLGNRSGTYDSKAKLPFGLELRAERLLPNFEMTTKLTLYLKYN